MANTTNRRYIGTLFLDLDDYNVIASNDPLQDSIDLHLTWLEDFANSAEVREHCRGAIATCEQCPDTGRIHIHWYAELKKPMRATGLCAAVPLFANSHWEVARGTSADCVAYCSKEDSKVFGPVTVGSFETHQGHRSDLDAFTAMVMEGASDAEIARAYPKTYLLHGAKIAALRAAIKTRPGDAAFIPKQWQQDLINRVKGPADDRSIIWVLDSRGGQGKSRLARHLYCEHGACVLSGKVADMAYLYNGERIVIFDITRAAAEHSDHLYTMAEQIKNRMVISTKYMSCTKACDEDVHVIFFSNQRPKEGMWSDDRVTLINLDL